jgi:hypothetical protein
MSRLTTLGPRIPAVAARLSRRPKVTDSFYSSAELRALVRELIAVRGLRHEKYRRPVARGARRGARPKCAARELRDASLLPVGVAKNPSSIKGMGVVRFFGILRPGTAQGATRIF